MKMLLVCPHFRNIEKGIVDSFRRIGVEVYPFFFSMGMDNHHYYQRLKLKLGLNINDFLEKEKVKFNERLKQEYEYIQPEIVYIIQGRWMAQDTIRLFRKTSYVVLYLWDMVSLFPEMEETFGEYNVIYSFDKNDTNQLCSLGYNANFKPSGYDSSIYFPIMCEKEYDLCFVGAMYPERVKLLKKIYNQLPGLNWAVYGEYAPIRKPIQWVKWRFSSDYKLFKNKNIDKTEVNEIYNKSKIVLSIVRSNQENGWSARLPEILGTKSFQLTTYFPAVEKEFLGCIVLYKNEMDCIYQIQYYLSHAKEREEIAERGFQKARSLSDDELNKIIIQEYNEWRRLK